MIYNDQFVWLHLPKCAGSKITFLFNKYLSDIDGLHQDPFKDTDDPSIAWHDTISKREKRDPSFSLSGRTVICSFRKLPSWLESRYSFEYNRNPDLPHNPESLLTGKFLESGGALNYADWYARLYIPRPLLEYGNFRFIRTEYFESDFKSVFGDYLNISAIPNRQYKKLSNSTKTSLPDNIREQLFNDNSSIYDHCPHWKFVENMAYDSLSI